MTKNRFVRPQETFETFCLQALFPPASGITLMADDTGAAYNFLFVEADLIHGVHNAGYAMALLKNSIQAVSK